MDMWLRVFFMFPLVCYIMESLGGPELLVSRICSESSKKLNQAIALQKEDSSVENARLLFCRLCNALFWLIFCLALAVSFVFISLQAFLLQQSEVLTPAVFLLFALSMAKGFSAERSVFLFRSLAALQVLLISALFSLL